MRIIVTYSNLNFNIYIFVFYLCLITIMSDSFRLVSFNCAGVKSKTPYITSLCDQADMVLLQETWLLPHETNLLDNVHADFDNFSISAVNTEESILIGRPYGGISIL